MVKSVPAAGFLDRAGQDIDAPCNASRERTSQGDRVLGNRGAKRVIFWGCLSARCAIASWGQTGNRAGVNSAGPAEAAAASSLPSEDTSARGTLARIQGSVLVLAQRVSTSPGSQYFREQQKIAKEDLKPDSFIAIRATTAPDGSLAASEIRELQSLPEDQLYPGAESPEGAGKKKKSRLRAALGRAMGGTPIGGYPGGGYPAGRPYPVGDPRGPGGLPGTPEVGVGDSDESASKQPRPGDPLPAGFIIGKLGESGAAHLTLLRDVLTDADTFIMQGDQQLSFGQLQPGQQLTVRGAAQSRRLLHALLVRVEASPEATPSGNSPVPSSPNSAPNTEKLCTARPGSASASDDGKATRR